MEGNFSMKMDELKQELKNRKIPQMLYSINDEGSQFNRMTLKKLESGNFIVYFDTKDGRRLYEVVFEDEESACDYVLSTFNKNYLK